jgi:hypothetical protein
MTFSSSLLLIVLIILNLEEAGARGHMLPQVSVMLAQIHSMQH